MSEPLMHNDVRFSLSLYACAFFMATTPLGSDITLMRQFLQNEIKAIINICSRNGCRNGHVQLLQ